MNKYSRLITMSWIVNRGFFFMRLIIFPKNAVDGGHTINQSRGVNTFIDDRFDLTLECIRRFYLNQASPLYSTLMRYKSFFDLFEDFNGYIDFFFLQDLVD